MSHHRLENYLRSARKRAGLSQAEVAYLLGCRSGTKVSRYERFARRPSLETTFAYEVVFGVPAAELLAGIFQEARRHTVRRARRLLHKLGSGQSTQRNQQKLTFLRAISVAPPPPFHEPS